MGAEGRRQTSRFSLDDPEVLARFVRSIREGVYITDADGRILDANPAFLETFGVESLAALRSYTAERLLVDPGRRHEELALLTRDGWVREFELEIRRPDGQTRTVLDTAYRVVDDDTGRVFFHGILVDISDRKCLEHQLRESAIRDALTGCFNRRYLNEQLRVFEDTGHSSGAIVLDIDGFKRFNDRHGHDRGDQVLVAFARFLARTVRAGDAVVRIGGDEFLVLLPDAGADVTAAIAARLADSGARDGPTSFSLGWAVRRGTEPLEDTIRRADHDLISVRARRRRSRMHRSQEKRS